VIHDRKIYRDVLADGKGVIEANNAKAATEFKNLMQELSL
jgi:chromosome partitioning protein